MKDQIGEFWETGGAMRIGESDRQKSNASSNLLSI